MPVVATSHWDLCLLWLKRRVSGTSSFLDPGVESMAEKHLLLKFEQVLNMLFHVEFIRLRVAILNSAGTVTYNTAATSVVVAAVSCCCCGSCFRLYSFLFTRVVWRGRIRSRVFVV